MMTKKQFYEQNNKLLLLDSKNWEFSTKSTPNLKVLISGYREIEKDYLYYCINDEIWEINLNVTYDWLSPLHTIKDICKMAFEDKASKFGNLKGKPVVIKFIEYKQYNQVEIDLDVFGKKVVGTASWIIPKTEEGQLLLFEDSLFKVKNSLFTNLEEYIKNEPTVEAVFKGKCDRGFEIDILLSRLKNEITKKELVDLVKNLILTLEEKNWINFKDI